MGNRIFWNMFHSQSKTNIYEVNGQWKVDIATPNMGFVALNEKQAKEVALRSIKRYICALIDDLEYIKKYCIEVEKK
jgi:hypothetical protein